MTDRGKWLVDAVLRPLPPDVRSELRLAGSKGGLYAVLTVSAVGTLELDLYRAGRPPVRLDGGGDLALFLDRDVWVAGVLRAELGLETYWLVDDSDVKGADGPLLRAVLPSTGGSR